ncbi:Hemolysin C [Vibrio thalassae]|uniref:Hemolysin C n=1 Tax=Vibrio thalassae TaxID=1243014 RepID=A0A240EIY8_9VIBR|nr:hemolysin family protein [Vibrio thalassae]SNX48657.1 Hemolysin C [Vibrio thalassae]
MDVILLVGLIGLNGLFAMSEIALVAAKSGRLRKMAERQKSAQLALQLKNNPTLFLSTIQIGITAIGILSGIFGEAILSAPLSSWLSEQGVDVEIASALATASVVITITYFAIVIGELVPKRLAQNNAEKIAMVVAYPIHWLSLVTSPFVKLLSVSTDAMLRLLGQKEGHHDCVTEEDIIALVREGSESGAIEQQELMMIRNLLHLNDRAVTSLMTPRSDIHHLDIDKPVEQALRELRQTKHSVWPVCRGGLDNIIGTISSKNLLDEYEVLSTGRLAKMLRKPRFVPESMKGLALLNHMQQTSSEMAFLVDEYGDVQGLVTHHDLLKSIAGQLGMAPQQVWAKSLSDGSWIIDGLIPTNELKHKLDIQELEGELDEGFQTLNGFISWRVGSVPTSGTHIRYQQWDFEVLKVKNNRIMQVRARRTEDAHD